MAEHVSESVGFTQDIFSPLQYCEVVEDGLHQRRLQQHLHQLSQHQHLSMQLQLQKNQNQSLKVQTHNTQQNVINESAQPDCDKAQAQLQQMKNEASSPEELQKEHSVISVNQCNQNIQSLDMKVSNESSQLIKKEPSQTATHVQQKVLDVHDAKSTVNEMSNTSVGLILSSMSNAINMSSSNPAVIAVQQEQLAQLYQVQLANQQNIHQLQLNSIVNEDSSNQLQNQVVDQIPVPNIIGLQSLTQNVFPPLSSSLSTQRNAVATQTNATSDQSIINGAQIYFLNVSGTGFEKDIKASTSCKTAPKDDVEILGEHTREVKPVPVKHTWRRPWKKKKEREKKVVVKKARRVKRRRISTVSKKSAIRIDPRNGPPIDTSMTLVRRETEETINQLKQKRQRIKLNRNSGREYVNRLGKIVVARKIGPPCNCPLRCWDRMGSKILDIFNNFWDLCDFNLQNSYLFTCLKLCDVKRRYTKKPADESRRQNTFEYFVRICGKHLRVCKRAFMSAHGLTSDKRLRTLFTQMKDGALIPELDKRGKHLRPNTKSPTRSNLSNHYESSLNPHTVAALSRAGRSSSQSTNRKKSSNTSRQKKSQLHRVLVEGKPIHHPMYPPPPSHPMSHLHSHCTATPPTAHGAMQDHSHAHSYIPNGDIYFPSHYLEPPQAMPPPHINQIPNCQKMLDTPAYFMAGMKENTFHQ